MIPLHDVHQPKQVPFITRLLIAINVAVFLYQGLNMLIGRNDAIIATMGVKPLCYINPSACGINPFSQNDLLWQPLFVSMFLHGGILHLAFNMLFLWVFGPRVEEQLGRWRFLLFYLGCGLAAGVAHIITHPLSLAPAIGASGAIAGILGLYLILLPRSWILTYFPPIFLFPVPAPLFLIAWVVFQVMTGIKHLPGFTPSAQEADVAWMAHIGGFAMGAFIGWTIKPWWTKREKAAT